MKSPVHDHLVARGERLAAELAAVRPGVRVDPLMLPEKVAALEVLRAERALGHNHRVN